MALVKVKVVQDGDCHWYIIPAELEDHFNSLLSFSENEEDWEVFEKVFDKYRTGGDLNNVELYANIE